MRLSHHTLGGFFLPLLSPAAVKRRTSSCSRAERQHHTTAGNRETHSCSVACMHVSACNVLTKALLNTDRSDISKGLHVCHQRQPVSADICCGSGAWMQCTLQEVSHELEVVCICLHTPPIRPTWSALPCSTTSSTTARLTFLLMLSRLRLPPKPS